MKKNTMMRVASVLLIAVLLTTSAISGTFAKYTTQDAASDAARVAKWGVELQVVGNLYGDHYGTGSVAPSSYVNANTASVSASASGTDVVAPGTIGDTGLTFSLNGTPEVSGEITTTIAYENVYLMSGKYGVMIKLGKIGSVEYAGIMANSNVWDKLYTLDNGTYSLATAYDEDTDYYTLEDYVDLTENYYPVEYKMTGTTTNYNTSYNTATTTDQLAAIAAALATNFGTEQTGSTVVAGLTTKTYKLAFSPNESLDTQYKAEDQNITWKWDFCQETNECDGGDAACMHCKADTILGLLAGTLTANGAVVKAGTTANTFVAPVAAAGENANDFNLETSFSINITVTQVD